MLLLLLALLLICSITITINVTTTLTIAIAIAIAMLSKNLFVELPLNILRVAVVGLLPCHVDARVGSSA